MSKTPSPLSILTSITDCLSNELWSGSDSSWAR